MADSNKPLKPEMSSDCNRGEKARGGNDKGDDPFPPLSARITTLNEQRLPSICSTTRKFGVSKDLPAAAAAAAATGSARWGHGQFLGPAMQVCCPSGGGSMHNPEGKETSAETNFGLETLKWNGTRMCRSLVSKVLEKSVDPPATVTVDGLKATAMMKSDTEVVKEEQLKVPRAMGLVDGVGARQPSSTQYELPERPARRRKWDMDRLRNRWWEALRDQQQQRIQRDLAEPLPAQRNQPPFDPPPSRKARESPSPTSYDSTRAPPDDAIIDQVTSCESRDSPFVVVADNTRRTGKAVDYDTSEEMALVLLDAICRNDAGSLHRLLLRMRHCHCDPREVGAAFLRMQREKDPRGYHHNLDTLESRSVSGSYVQTSGRSTHASDVSEPLSPLLLAARMGHDECLQILVGSLFICNSLDDRGHSDGAKKKRLSSPSSWYGIKDSQGNHVLHTWCRSGDSPTAASTLRWLLRNLAAGVTDRIGEGTHAYDENRRRAGSQQRLLKTLLARNRFGQTPLHAACQLGRAEMVEILLRELSASIVNKLWCAVDETGQTPLLAGIASGSIDVVMSLLMWRGNNHDQQHPSLSSNTRDDCFTATAPCPLARAVQLRDIDMVQLLFEFKDPTSSRGIYNVTRALHVAVLDGNKPDCDEPILDLIHILVDAGGNPCAVEKGLSESALSAAVRKGDPRTLQALLEAYDAALCRTRTQRRLDPVLQKQPESYFSGIESQENSQQFCAMSEALVCGLTLGHQSMARASDSYSFYQCCHVLYRHGAQLDDSRMLRLQASLASSCLVPSTDLPYSHVSQSHVLEFHTAASTTSDEQPAQSEYWSRVMKNMPWVYTACDCFSVRGAREVSDMTVIPAADVALVCSDGTRYPAHSTVLSRKSDKLAACLRFSSMSTTRTSDEDLGDGCLEIPVDVPRQLVAWMLQHMYHGSLLLSESQVAADPVRTANSLLELLVMAEELLCASLMLECEMRLLSSEPWVCYCSDCASRWSASVNSIPHRYCVRGPSLCLEGVGGATALDVLAVVQEMYCLEKPNPEDDINNDGDDVDKAYSGRYRIFMKWISVDNSDLRPIPASINSERQCAVPALVSLRYVAAKSLLRNMRGAWWRDDEEKGGGDNYDGQEGPAYDARPLPALMDQSDKHMDQGVSQSSVCCVLEACMAELADTVAAISAAKNRNSSVGTVLVPIVIKAK
jgi:ankyrin repeat protein